MSDSTTLEWLGCTTFRLKTRGLTLFFDSYLDGDRAPGAEAVGLSASAVSEADFVFVSHAHFDHMLGADTIAENAGSVVVGSYEVARVLAQSGVATEQILPVSGGEPIDCSHDVRVRAFPSLHSCVYASKSRDSSDECLGDIGVSAQDRRAYVETIMTIPPGAPENIRRWAASGDRRSSIHDGGQLSYLVETPDGSVFVSSSAGYWSGIVRDLRADVAIIAASGRPNVDGEPYQGSLAQFMLGEVEMIRPNTVVFSHHDALMPPVMPATDTEEAAKKIANEANYASVLTMRYSEPVAILT
jgi:L-ascorbate metabolism protein UlaG (beta-lactamase superfamily)